MEKTAADKTGVIGIDIGGTNFRAGLVDEALKVEQLVKIPVGQVFHTRDPIDDLGRYLEGYMRDTGAVIRAISIGFPAAIDKARRVVLQAPNVPFMEKLPVADALEDVFGIPVFVERDVTMSLLYDMGQNGYTMEHNICGIYFGTGIGNAMVINGALMVGKHGTAGELGHIPADGSDIWCGCGNRGCYEALAGGKHLKRLCEERFKDTAVERIFVEQGHDPEVQRFIDRMAQVVSVELNVLDPDVMIVGGGVPEMEGFPRELFLERVAIHARKPQPAEDMNIIFAGDAREKAVVGAAIYAYSKL